MASKRKRRGATFTLLVVVFSMVLLIGAGALVDTTKQTFTYAAYQGQSSRLREAAFAGVTWAATAADQGLAEGTASFKLSGPSTSVTFTRRITAQGPRLSVVSTATRLDRVLVVKAELRTVEDRFKLESFSID
jgi:hypothetical protein